MRLEDIPDTPAKYRSKREYILTPPDITVPDYSQIKEETKPTPRPRFEEPVKSGIQSKVTLNSDIFVTDTEDFYKDAKVIEGKDINIEDKIQEIKPKQNAFDWQNNEPATKQFQAEEESTIQEKTDFSGLNVEDIKIQTDNSWQNEALEEQIDSFDDFEDDIQEESAYDNVQETANTNNLNQFNQDIKLASPNTAEVVHTSTFTTQQNVFKKELVEEKKEENLLGRPKKHHQEYVKPPADLLEYIENTDVVTDEECNENIERLERVLQDFKINA